MGLEPVKEYGKKIISLNMNQEKISALLSLITAFIILVASFFQWWNITWDGNMELKQWVRVVFIICVALLITSGILLFY